MQCQHLCYSVRPLINTGEFRILDEWSRPRDIEPVSVGAQRFRVDAIPINDQAYPHSRRTQTNTFNIHLPCGKRACRQTNAAEDAAISSQTVSSQQPKSNLVHVVVPGSSPLGSQVWAGPKTRHYRILRRVFFSFSIVPRASWRGKIDESHVRVWIEVSPACSSNGPNQRSHDRRSLDRGHSDVREMLLHVNTCAWTM